MSKKSTGKAGIGTKLMIMLSGVFQPISNVTTMSAGGATVNMIDVTQMESPDFYSEARPGLKTSVDWTFTIQWNPSDVTHNSTLGLAKLIEDRTKCTFRVDASALGITQTLDIDGYISEFGNAAFSPEALITRDITVKPTGRVRFGTVISSPPSLDFSQAESSGYVSLL